jgi:hypothetical protein
MTTWCKALKVLTAGTIELIRAHIWKQGPIYVMRCRVNGLSANPPPSRSLLTGHDPTSLEKVQVQL